MVSEVGKDWSAEAARSYLSFLSVTSSEFEKPKDMAVVLAAPCHPSQLHGLTLLAEAGILSFVVLLEQRKPKSWGVFDKNHSSTGTYLHDIGLSDCGWVEWDATAKAEARLEQVLLEVGADQPSFFVICCRDQSASEEPLSLVTDRHTVLKASLDTATGSPQLQTVFGGFLKSLQSLVPRESIYWVPPEIPDLVEFRRRLSLFRRIQLRTPGRPILALDSALLPLLYSDIRDWCESPDRDNPIFLVYESGLPAAGRSAPGGLTDGLLLLSVPGLNVAVPADEEQARTLFEEADSLEGPTALVFCQSPAVGLSSKSLGTPGRGRVLREGKDLALVALGSTVFPSLLAAESLNALGISVAVIDLRYRRPLDKELIASLNRFPLLVSVDEHPEAGGIAGHLWRPESASCKLIRLGIEVEDVQNLLQKGEREELTLEHFGLHAEGIARCVRESLHIAPPSAFG